MKATGAKRGRPRDQTARRRILAAARALMEQGGIAAVTMEELAASARVGKPTIYRSWPNAQAVAMAALIDMPAASQAPRAATGLANQLRRHLRAVAAAFATRAGRSAATLIAAADGETEIAKAFRHHVILRSREEARVILLRARERGQLRAAVDIETALDLLLAPVFFRLLLGHAPLDEKFADAVVDHCLKGLAATGRN